MIQDTERLIAYDVALCKAMVDELEDYLKSRVLFWEPNRRRAGGASLPKLTIGGLLLAMRRLEALSDYLSAEQLRALKQAQKELTAQKSWWGIRYGTKLTRDLRSRLDNWAWYIDDLEENGAPVRGHYPRQVETRVKIELLLEEASEIGLDAEESRERQIALDERLRPEFVSGDFCWPDPLAAGFPAHRFWYLWGHARSEDD